VANFILSAFQLIATRQASIDADSFNFNPLLVDPEDETDPRVVFATTAFVTLTDELSELLLNNYLSTGENRTRSIANQLNDKRDIILLNTQTLTSQITSVQNAGANAETLMASTLSAVAAFKSTAKIDIDNYIPVFVSLVVSGAAKADVILNTGLPCVSIGRDVRAIEQSVCSVLLLGIDAVWFSYFFISLVGLVSLPVFFIAAKRFGPKPKNRALDWRGFPVVIRNKINGIQVKASLNYLVTDDADNANDDDKEGGYS
jgi:hypothetical protein